MATDKRKYADRAEYLKAAVKVRKELDKCVLICANCHGEIHAGLRSL